MEISSQFSGFSIPAPKGMEMGQIRVGIIVELTNIYIQSQNKNNDKEKHTWMVKNRVKKVPNLEMPQQMIPQTKLSHKQYTKEKPQN